MLSRIYGKGRPFRLFVAGLHGNEWKDTSHRLMSLRTPSTGTLILVPIVDREDYISTLDSRYYDGPGKLIAELIETYNPEVYVEFHSYMKESFEHLTGMDRIDHIGVPAYSVLEKAVLVGSVSPHIRLSFPPDALCLSFEMEKGNSQSGEFALEMLNSVKECSDRDEFIAFMMKKYPKQAQKAMEDYRKFYGL